MHAYNAALLLFSGREIYVFSTQIFIATQQTSPLCRLCPNLRYMQNVKGNYAFLVGSELTNIKTFFVTDCWDPDAFSHQLGLVITLMVPNYGTCKNGGCLFLPQFSSLTPWPLSGDIFVSISIVSLHHQQTNTARLPPFG